MAKDPAARFPTMRAFAAALDEYLNGTDTLVESPGVVPEPFGDLAADEPAPRRPTRPRSRLPLLIGAAGSR